jgi:hypothetical protein
MRARYLICGNQKIHVVIGFPIFAAAFVEPANILQPNRIASPVANKFITNYNIDLGLPLLSLLLI